MDVVIDAGMAGCAAAAPLLLAASCSCASSCPLLVADGCMTGPASSSSARLVEAEAVACVVGCSKPVKLGWSAMSLGWDTERLSGLSTDCHTQTNYFQRCWAGMMYKNLENSSNWKQA